MFIRFSKAIIILAIAFLVAVPVFGGYYEQETKKGWWWYETIPEPVKEDPEKRLEQQGQTVTKKYPRDFSLDNVTVEQLWEMHPDDFQALYDVIHKKSVQYPDDEKYMREYFIMTDTARRKALAFANSNQAWLQKNPSYNMSATIPMTTPGKVAVTKMQTEEKGRTIREGQENHALVYFSKPGCKFCEAQGPILDYFAKKYSWNIKKVDISQNPSAAATFNVQTVPMVILIKKGNNEHIPVTVGVASAHEIEEKVYRGMRMLGGEEASAYSTYEYQKDGGQAVKAPLRNKKTRQR